MLDDEQREKLVLDSRETYAIAAHLKKYGSDDEALIDRDFLLRFSYILVRQILENGQPSDEVPSEELEVSEKDLMVLRELIPFVYILGGRPIGVQLHRKIGAALLLLNPEVAQEVKIGEVEDPNYDDRLEKWRKKNERSNNRARSKAGG